MSKGQTNADIARLLDRIAELLEYENANPFRVRAYHEGAQSIRNADHPVADFIHRNQTEKLDALPGIGSGITAVVSEYITSGKSALLEELEAKASPEAVMAKVPGIGKELAGRIVDQLHIKTLPELEQAAYNGELATVEGFGEKRLEGIRAALAGMLSQSARSNQRKRTSNGSKQAAEPEDRPSVTLLLDIDEEYRTAAKENKLQKIAPRRFNPNNEAWLPILHAKRADWEFTALYSNTAQAHKLGKIDDWVVIYYKRGDTEQQHTVVTETKGSLKGKRVVRGRDAENRTYYNAATA